MKKIKSLISLACLYALILNLFAVMPAEASLFYSYTDDFSSYTPEMYESLGTDMQGNWRTATAGECSQSTVKMGYDGSRLKISTNTKSVDTKYTTDNEKVFAAAVFTGDRTTLYSGQKISVKAKKTHQSDMWGVRFCVHEGEGGELSCYTLLFGGMYTYSATSGRLTWGLYKSTGGTVTKLAEKTRDGIGSVDAESGYMGTGDAILNLSFLNGKIDWSLSYTKDGVSYAYNESYTDAVPFNVGGADTTVHLFAAGSDESSRYVYFDDFMLENNWPLSSYEPYSYFDDFSSYTSNMYEEFGTSMQGSWRTPTTAECDRSAVKMGYDGGKLKVSTNTGTAAVKYTTSNALAFQGAVLTADRSGLYDEQKISVKARKSHQSDMWGVRFYVHDGTGDTLNYYALFFGGMYTYSATSGRLTWGLYKCTNGTVTKLAEKTREGTDGKDTADGYMSTGDAELVLTVSGGKIDWNLTYTKDGESYGYNESCTDATPFDVSDKDLTVHLFAAGSDDPSRYIYFDDFKLESSLPVPYSTYSYSDDFSAYSANMYNEFGASMQGNWRTPTTAECDRSAISMGYDGDKLKISTNTDTAAIKYTTSNALAFSGAVLTAGRSGLSDKQKISVKAKKTHQSDMWGVRFYVHDGTGDTLNYYTLFFGGMYTYAQSSGYLTWGLYKSTNGTVTRLAEKTREGTGGRDTVNGYMGTGDAELEITVSEGEINWSLNYTKDGESYGYNESCTDASPFEVSGSDTTVHLYAAGSNDPSRYVYFDDFELESLTERIAPENAFFVNLMEGASIDGCGVADLKKLSVIDELYYGGAESINADILVSKDKSIWYTLAKPESFTDRVFVNNLNTEEFRYIYAERYIYDLLVLKEQTEELSLFLNEEITLYPRLAGVNYFSQGVLSSSNSEVAAVTGNTVTASGIGTAVITAGNGSASLTLQFAGVHSGDEYNEPETLILYKDALEGKTPSGGIYELEKPSKIRRFAADVAAENLSVFVSADGIKWYKVCTLQAEDDYLNHAYTDEYSFIKIQGTGSVKALVEAENEKVLLLPGQSMTVYPYTEGALCGTAAFSSDSAYLNISGRSISLPFGINEATLTVTAGGYSKTLKVGGRFAALGLNVSFTDGNLFLELTGDELDGRNVKLEYMIYNSDKSLYKLGFSDISFTGGEASFNLSDAGYVGRYIKVRVTDNNLIPLTETVTVN